MVVTADRPTGAVTEPAARRDRVSPLVATLLLALIPGAAYLGFDKLTVVRDADSRAATQAKVVEIASDKVLDLTRFSANTAERDTQRLLKGVTDEFRTNYQDQVKAFSSAVARERVTSTGTVASAGLKSLDDDTAEVLVAATGTVQNKKADEPQPRYYRLLVELKRVGDDWLVNGLEFVA